MLDKTHVTDIAVARQSSKFGPPPRKLSYSRVASSAITLFTCHGSPEQNDIKAVP